MDTVDVAVVVIEGVSLPGEVIVWVLVNEDDPLAPADFDPLAVAL